MSLKPGVILGIILLVGLLLSCFSETPSNNRVVKQKEVNSVFSDKLLPIKQEVLTTTDGIEPSTIRRIMDKRKSSFKVCYKKALEKFPGIKGNVLVSFNVSPTGRVSTVKIEQSTLNSTEAINCIRRVVRHVQFPPVSSGKRVKIQYPLTFAP